MRDARHPEVPIWYHLREDSPLTKKDELHMPGPAHCQKQPQLEQGLGGGGGEGGANGKPSVRTQRRSHTFATLLLVLSL